MCAWFPPCCTCSSTGGRPRLLQRWDGDVILGMPNTPGWAPVVLRAEVHARLHCGLRVLLKRSIARRSPTTFGALQTHHCLHACQVMAMRNHGHSCSNLIVSAATTCKCPHGLVARLPITVPCLTAYCLTSVPRSFNNPTCKQESSRRGSKPEHTLCIMPHKSWIPLCRQEGLGGRTWQPGTRQTV